MKPLAWLLGAAAVCKDFCATEYGENVCDKDHAATCGTCEGCTNEGDAGGGEDSADEQLSQLLIIIIAGAASVACVIVIGGCNVWRKVRRARVYAVAQVPSNPKRIVQHGGCLAAQLAALPQKEATNID